MRLIDADALKLYATGGVTSVGLLTLAEIDNAPTIDAVPVVRCEDCKHCTFHEFQFTICWRRNNMVCRDDFCSYGERKEAEGK